MVASGVSVRQSVSPGWPFCPPDFLPDARRLLTRGGFFNPSLDGGLPLLLLFSRGAAPIPPAAPSAPHKQRNLNLECLYDRIATSRGRAVVVADQRRRSHAARPAADTISMDKILNSMFYIPVGSVETSGCLLVQPRAAPIVGRGASRRQITPGRSDDEEYANFRCKATRRNYKASRRQTP